MARQEADREDLLREATALVQRIELSVEGYEEPVVIGFRCDIGFRRNGAASIYLGQDTAYHFNRRGELRRCYLDGRLIKAELRKLAALVRQREEGQVNLMRHDLDEKETVELLTILSDHLSTLQRAIAASHFTIIGQVPETCNVIDRVRGWLESFTGKIDIASTPHVSV